MTTLVAAASDATTRAAGRASGFWNRLSPASRRALRDGPIVAGLIFLVYLFVDVAPKAGTVGFDALSYWIYSIDDPYAITHGTMGSFVYSPVAARLFQLDSLLPFWQFLWLWEALLLGTVLWLGGRRWWLVILAFPPVALELYHGNIHLLIAAAIALGFRYPAAWAFVLLTKVTPGIGLLWFAVRREWRSLGIAVGVTLALVAASLVVDTRLWIEWWEKELLVSLRTPPDQPQIAIPLVVRLAAAAAIVTVGALTNRKWTVPLAAALAMPVLWIAAFAVLAAIPAVGRPELRSREEEAANLASESASTADDARSNANDARVATHEDSRPDAPEPARTAGARS
ncbi:MAG TPA: glycosyltransferase family 87 protein [Candidatus Binatia bacterium]|nr:glycosyltransferase family 87 protein [Candidatus Binatia bacterium]